MVRIKFSMFLFFLTFFSGIEMYSFDNRPDYAKELYGYFIDGKIDLWNSVINQMEEDYAVTKDPTLLKQIIVAQYGLIGYQLGVDDDKSAEKLLNKMEKNLESILDDNVSAPAWAFAMKGATIGYRIGLNNWRAPFIGGDATKNMNKAIQTDSLEAMGWVELGNSYLYRPALFGGSSEKALNYYLKAVSLFEQDSSLMVYNWIYLNLHVLIAECYINLKQEDQALKTYEKIIETEPGFSWVVDELMPDLKKSMLN